MTSMFDPDQYVDDWHCKECGHGPLSEVEDMCTLCGSTWAEQNDGVLSEADSLDEMREIELDDFSGVEGVDNWEEWN